MCRTRFKKVFKDLWEKKNRSRSILVLIAITVGIVGLNLNSIVYSILDIELERSYLAANPASVSIVTDPIDDTIKTELRKLPQVKMLEARRKILGRLMIGPNNWKTIWLFVIEGFKNIRIDIIESEKGGWNPGKGEILIERKAFQVAKAEIGDTVTILTKNGEKQQLLITGSVYDINQPAAQMEDWVYGYISVETLQMLGEGPYLNELKIIITDHNFDIDTIKKGVKEIISVIRKNNMNIHSIHIPEPGKHPHNDQLLSFAFLLQIFGLLTLILSGFLIYTMITALLARQVRQIGIMKSIGATGRQLLGIYLLSVFILCMIAYILAMPIAVPIGKMIAGFPAMEHNFNINTNNIPLWVFILLFLLSILIPIIATIYPIYRSSRITTWEALHDYSVIQHNKKAEFTTSLFSRLRIIYRPLLLSLRNTFRRRGRLFLSLFTLTMGGIIFLTASNIQISINNTIDTMLKNKGCDIEITFHESYDREDIQKVLNNINNIDTIDYWDGTKASIIYPDGLISNQFQLVASSLKFKNTFTVIKGRWMQPQDENSVVVNQMLAGREPGIKIGDSIISKLAGKEIKWNIIGIIRQIGTMPTMFCNYKTYMKIAGQVNKTSIVRIKSLDNDEESILRTKYVIEKKLEENNYKVLNMLSLADNKKVLKGHLMLIVIFILIMGITISVVGGLGVISIISINIMERTREIGIMRAIGASNRAIIGIFLTESSIIGLLSFIFGFLLSIPCSIYIGKAFGNMIIKLPLDISLNPIGVILWFIIIVSFTLIGSFFPCWRAIRITVKDVLAYE